jgi:hypothetical protein
MQVLSDAGLIVDVAGRAGIGGDVGGGGVGEAKGVCAHGLLNADYRRV